MKAAVPTSVKAEVRKEVESGILDAYFKKYFGDSWKTAKAICTAESGLRNVTGRVNSNGTRDHGVCQINDIHKGKVGGDISKLYDPETNIRIAGAIFKASKGFSPWTVYKTGAYRKYLL